MAFECSQCGACCRAIKCPLLTEDNLCSDYENRPIWCRVDEGYDVFFKDKMTKDEYYHMNKVICIKLQEQEKQ